MMRFELGPERPDPKRAPVSASYMLVHSVTTALLTSVVATGLALLIFGAVKGHFTGAGRLKSGFRTLLVGGLAAGAAFGLAHLFG